MKTVLVVDDKEENLYYLEALLGGSGFRVERARHGAEALVRARRQAPDLIISDLLMPVMDGYTLLRHCKADAQLRRVPFIVYTATYTEPADERLALSLGADAFILKPAEPEVFLGRIREVQGRPRRFTPVPFSPPPAEEKELLKVYSEALIRKLEEKMLQLEATNRRLEEDIAQRQRAEEKLREQATLLNKAQDAIIVRDLQHRIRYWNQGAERLYGWTEAEAIGQSIVALLYGDSAAFESAAAAILEHGEWIGQLQHRSRKGKNLVIESRWTLVRDQAGLPKSILSINTDITARQQLEQQFLRAQRLESIGTLAGGIAHDLNNLLAPILMGVDLLRESNPDHQSLEVIENIGQSARRGADLVKQVLSFARGVEGARVTVPIMHLLREIEAIVVNTFPKNIHLQIECPDDLSPVVGDPTQLHQVLLNLCVNARDAMPQGGRLRLAAHNVEVAAEDSALEPGVAAGKYVVLEVSDEGVGMSPTVLERVFEPFFTTKEVGKGTGLGLSTVLGIVRSHGGLLRVSSEEGQGTVFRVFLLAQAEPKARSGVANVAKHLPPGQGEGILVVDDEGAILILARQTLQSFGYRVWTAAGGAQALDLHAEHRKEIGAVITDLMMPGMDGAALIAALRERDPDLVIIAASGRPREDTAPPDQSAQPDAFLPKPYSAQALLTTLRTVLDARPPAGAD